ncbi:MAG: cupredoxin domain-containing protein [Chloroflexi bacterium]|nr:cupredoxin domain-containing protein [Chloroflexota bacterium]
MPRRTLVVPRSQAATARRQRRPGARSGGLLLLLPWAVLVLTLAGCAGPAASAQPAETTQVAMAKSYKFDPATIQVPVGATVTWTNQDNFTHDVHLLGGSDWRSKPLPPGESVSYTFAQAGEYAYECTFHPQNMKGKVIVAAP